MHHVNFRVIMASARRRRARKREREGRFVPLAPQAESRKEDREDGQVGSRDELVQRTLSLSACSLFVAYG